MYIHLLEFYTKLIQELAPWFWQLFLCTSAVVIEYWDWDSVHMCESAKSIVIAPGYMSETVCAARELGRRAPGGENEACL